MCYFLKLCFIILEGFSRHRFINYGLYVLHYPFFCRIKPRIKINGSNGSLNDISKNKIAFLSADEVYSRACEWAKTYDGDFYAKLTENEAKQKAIINLDREGKNPRKDIAKWDELKNYFSYFYPEYYEENFTLPEHIGKEDAIAILKAYSAVYSPEDQKDEWFSKIKDLCEPLGFTPNVKEFKQNPDAFKGHVGDVSTVIRIAITSRTNTPDLCAIMGILGKDEVLSRIERAIKFYEN